MVQLINMPGATGNRHILVQNGCPERTRKMPTSPIKNLLRELEDGLSIVSRIWDMKTKNWVTSVSAADIDFDAEPEIIACSREGRVYLIAGSDGEFLWK